MSNDRSGDGLDSDSFLLMNSQFTDLNQEFVSSASDASETQSIVSSICQNKRSCSCNDSTQKRRKREIDALLIYIEELLDGFEIEGKTMEEIDGDLETLTSSVLSLQNLDVKNNEHFTDPVFRLLKLTHFKTRELLDNETPKNEAGIIDVTGALQSIGKELYSLCDTVEKKSDFKLEHCCFLLKIATVLEMIPDPEKRLDALQTAKCILDEMKAHSHEAIKLSILIDLQLMECSLNSPPQTLVSTLLEQYHQFVEAVDINDEEKVDLALKAVTLLTQRASNCHKYDSSQILNTALEILNLTDSVASPQIITAKNSILLSLGELCKKQNDFDGVMRYLDQVSFAEDRHSMSSANSQFSRVCILQTDALIKIDNRHLRCKLFELLYSHATSTFLFTGSPLVLHFLESALFFSNSDQRVKIARTLTIGHLLHDTQEYKTKEVIALCKNQDANNVLDELLLLWLALEQQETNKCQEILQSLHSCLGFDSNSLKIVYQEARRHHDHQIAREALVLLEKYFPSLEVYQHLLMEMEDSTQGLSISWLHQWLHKAVLKVKEINIQQCEREDSQYQQVMWILQYCLSKSLQASKSGDYEISALLSETSLELCKHLNSTQKSDNFLSGLFNVTYQKSIIVLIASLLKINRRNVNHVSEYELKEEHLNLLEQISQQTVISKPGYLYLKMEALCTLQDKQRLCALLEKSLVNFDLDFLKTVLSIAKRHGMTHECWISWIAQLHESCQHMKISWVIQGALKDVRSDEVLTATCKALLYHWNYNLQETMGEISMCALRKTAEKLLESRIHTLKTRGVFSLAKEFEETLDALRVVQLAKKRKQAIQDDPIEPESNAGTEDSSTKNWMELIVGIPGVFDNELVLDPELEDINELCFESD
eukprot:g5713.t1